MRLTHIAFVALSFLGCAPCEFPTPQPSAHNLKVKVMADGRVLTDSGTVSLEQLGKQLAALKAKNGTVWYYREAAAAEPHPNAMEVIKLVVDNKLPIALSAKADFSDIVGPDGVSRPR
jgi:biopolymer transport protein ExbD